MSYQKFYVVHELSWTTMSYQKFYVVHELSLVMISYHKLSQVIYSSWVHKFYIVYELYRTYDS
jgi:hypothetical protein